MTQEECKRWNNLTDIIQADIAYYGILRMEATSDEDAHAYGSVSLALEKIFTDIKNLLYPAMLEEAGRQLHKQGD